MADKRTDKGQGQQNKDATLPPGDRDSGGSRRHLPHANRARRPLLSFRLGPVSPLPGETEQYKGTPRHLIVSGVVLTVLISLLMTVSFLPSKISIQAGTPATEDIYSPTFLRYESKVLTDRARQEAMSDSSNEVWVQDSNVIQRQRSMLLSNLSVMDNVRDVTRSNTWEQHPPIASLQGMTLTNSLQNTLVSLPDSEYRYWRDSAVVRTFDAAMRDQRLASDADLQAATASLPDRLPPTLSADEKAAAVAFISPLLAVNMSLDADQTHQRQQDASANVKPVIVTVQKGETILRQGDLATPEAIEKMQEAELVGRGLSPQYSIAAASLVLLLMLLLHLYIYRYAVHVWKRQKQLLLVGLLILATIGAGRILLPGHALLPYFLPLASVSMLIAVLINPNLAMLVTFVLSLLLGLVANTSLSIDLPFFYFISGLTGIFTLTKVERVTTFARASIAIALASFVGVLMLRFVSGSTVDWIVVEQLALASLFNGLVSGSITYATFSLLGTLFGITTPVQLMELAHPDQPLLTRLMREAPGTYHHSLVVSNLAERAAEMVGADALLARVSAYYHDIGKVVRPYYFIDNQSGIGNVHDELPPRTSAAIIAEHVRDGVRLGQKYRLPRRVLDAIPQHHGTMLIKYFYNKALAEDPEVDADDFRYPGPKPQTKETAILMLADGVEAAVRSMVQNGTLNRPAANNDATESPGRYTDAPSLLSEDAIAGAVHKIIGERIEDGQLDECDLTVRDIARIQEAFVSMLKGIYHPRVAYPETPRVSANKVVVPLLAVDGHTGSSPGGVDEVVGVGPTLETESQHEQGTTTAGFG